jgi:long-chain acyl-CoA synthetase
VHVAAWLIQNGLKREDHVAIFMKNRPEYLRLLFGIWHAEGVVVPENAWLYPKEAAWIFKMQPLGLFWFKPCLKRPLKLKLKNASL